MSIAYRHSDGLGRARRSAPIVDKFAIVPILACAFATMIGPFSDFIFALPGASAAALQSAEPGVTNRIFWPVLATVSVALAAQSRFRLASWPPHIRCLLVYVAFAGTSVLWAFRPEISFTRYMQQLMVVTSIVLPAMLARRTVDLMRGMFVCFALAALLNVLVVALDGSMDHAKNGYPGYFLGKNYLGEFAGPAFLLALYEVLHSGLRRALGTIAAAISLLLLFLSDSKTALGLAFICPLLAGFALIIRSVTRASLATIIWLIPLGYVIMSGVSNVNMYRISYMIYGDSTFTGRAIIWDFAQYEIDRKPLLGWGYQSFWLVGPDAPSVLDAPGWVKNMPEAHNGYYDTKLELGYVGFVLLLIFITSTLHALGRVADRNSARAWLMLSLALFVLVYNFIESLWMRGFEFLWVVFLILVAEIARCWQPLSLKRRRKSPARQDPSNSDPDGGVEALDPTSVPAENIWGASLRSGLPLPEA